MRLRGFSVAVAAFVLSATLVGASPAEAATGTTVTPAVVTGSGLGFDAAGAPSTAVLRAWSSSPYRAVNLYFSGTQRFDPTQTQLGSDPTWTATALSNGWSLIPTVVDLQAPCYGGKKAKMSSDAATATAQGQAVARQAHTDLTKFGLGGTVAYLDLENFDIPAGNTTCGPAVKAFVRGFTSTLHYFHEKAGVYFNAHHGATTIVAMYGHASAPDDVWVANWNDSATTGDASIGSKWLHHRIHQYWSDGTNGHPLETYGSETINVDRDAIDGDVVTAKSVSIAGYNVSAPGTGLKERLQPNTSQPPTNTLADGSPLDITCQATGQTVDGDYVWDKLSDGFYVSDLYTTTTGRNWVSARLPKCDRTPPTLSTTPLPQVTVWPTATVRWAAADQADPTGTPPGETRGISGTTVRYRYATPNAPAFTGWKTLTTTTASSAKLSLAVGVTYCVQVQTFDLSANASPWSAQSCTTRPFDDRSLAASSGWVRKTSSHYYRSTFTKTVASGRTLSIGVRGRRIGVLAATCPSCGVVAVYIGSQYVGRVNLHSSGIQYKRLFMLRPFALRSGTVKLVTKGAHLVQIDGLVISRV